MERLGFILSVFLIGALRWCLVFYLHYNVFHFKILLCSSPVSVTGYYLDYSSLEDSRESEHPRGILDAITGFIPGFGPRPTRRPRPPGPGQRPPINVSCL